MMELFEQGKIKLYRGDCMELLRNTPDNFYDLCMVDPPYGIGEGNKKNKTRSSFTGFGDNKKWVQAKDYGGGEWDSSAPPQEYFTELKRVSKNQIIWGANHFIDKIPYGSPCWIVWDKDNGDCDQADCELAYTSYKTAVRKAKFRWHGLLQQNMKQKEERIHPTQKPVALYLWQLEKYATPDMKILDTHLGSGSSAIAAHYFGCEFTGIEIDQEYYDAAVKRFKENTKQQELFIRA